jgi:hypothetical protein
MSMTKRYFMSRDHRQSHSVAVDVGVTDAAEEDVDANVAGAEVAATEGVRNKRRRDSISAAYSPMAASAFCWATLEWAAYPGAVCIKELLANHAV